MTDLLSGTVNVAVMFATLLAIGAAVLLPIAGLAYLSSIYKTLRRIEALLAARKLNDEHD